MEKKQNLRTNQVPAKVLLNSDARKSNQGNVSIKIQENKKKKQQQQFDPLTTQTQTQLSYCCDFV